MTSCGLVDRHCNFPGIYPIFMVICFCPEVRNIGTYMSNYTASRPEDFLVRYDKVLSVRYSGTFAGRVSMFAATLKLEAVGSFEMLVKWLADYMLSSTDENSFDLDGIGRIPHLRTKLADKTYRVCQKHRSVSTKTSFTFHWLLLVKVFSL